MGSERGERPTLVVRVPRRRTKQHAEPVDVLEERGVRASALRALRRQGNRGFAIAASAVVLGGALAAPLVAVELAGIERREQLYRIERTLNQWPK